MNKIRTLGILGLLFIAGSAAAPLSAQDQAPGGDGAHQQPPAPLPMRPVALPEFHEGTLDNGAKIIVVEDHETPIVSLNLRIRSGAAADPQGKAGVAALTAALLDKGTESRTAREIAETIDFVGGTLGASASDDWTNIGATVLTEYVDTALMLLSDIVLHPTFPEEELEIERQRTLSSLQVELSQPAALAARRFMAEVYGSHPYGVAPTPESVRAIQQADLRVFHQAHYRPEDALFVVAGDVDPDDIIARLDRRFADWAPGAAPRPAWPEPPARSAREIILIHKPGSVQAVIRIGHLLPPATDADWITLDVAQQVLGGGTTGWFFRTLRGEKGYTYGAYATAAQRLDAGYFQAWAEVRNEVADSALAEFFRLLDQIREAPVPAEDLRTAKDYMIGSFALGLETPQQVAGQVAGARLLGLPDDYVATYRERVAAVTAEDIQRVMQEDLHPDRAAVVVVGDATKLREKLEAFGPIQIYDVRGAPLAAEDLGIHGASVRLDGSSIQSQTLVYQLLVQGNPVSEVTNAVTREMVEGKDAVRIQTSGTGMVSTQGDLAFEAASFAPLYATSEQGAGGQSVKIELRAVGPKVTGSLSLPGGQVRPIEVDLVPGLLLPGMDEPAIWVADLAPGKEFSFPMITAQTAGATTIRVEVVGESTVTVPAGEFEVYELEVSAGGATSRVYARKAAPHVIVKQELGGQPVVIQLKELK
ncbi:MAG TPA: pitrilysin family protein [Longimicrobiales bacterium]